MFYAHLNFHPLLIFVCILAPVLLLVWGRHAFPFELTEKRLRAGTGLLVAVSVIAAANYFGVIGFYLASPAYLDHVEPTIAANAYVLHLGQPLYHSADASECYSLVYGPLSYLPYSLAMRLAPYGFLSCKLVAAVACLLTLWVGILCLRKWVKGQSLVIASGLLVVLFLALGPDAFLVRADPLLCLFVALGLWAAARAGTAAAVVLLAVALGAAVNVKVHALLYFVFPLLLLAQRSGRKAACFAVLGAGVISAFPFLLPQISLRNWLQVLLVVGQHGFGFDEAIWAGQWFIYLGLFIAGPLWLLRLVKSSLKPLVSGAENTCWAGLLLSMAGTLLFASKSGARPVQWLPLVPMLLYAAVSIIHRTNGKDLVEAFSNRPWLQAAGLAFFLTALTSAGIQEAKIISAIRQQNPYTRAIYAELGRIMKALPNKKICMGCGLAESEFVSTHFLPLVFANQPYLLDPVAVMDSSVNNLPLPNRTLEIIARKVVDVWLIPRDDPPFAMLNPFPPHRPLFDASFRQTFAANYALGGSSQFFDVYVRR